jgi:hypothetical protein
MAAKRPRQSAAVPPERRGFADLEVDGSWAKLLVWLLMAPKHGPFDSSLSPKASGGKYVR